MVSAGADRIVVGVSGASGVSLALAFLGVILERTCWDVELVLSRGGEAVWGMELEGVAIPEGARVRRYADDAIGASVASGSYPTRGMVVIPCSMGSVARIAHGISDSLLTRAADVTLKERRPLVVVPRETPLSVIHLENLLRLSRAGAIVMPPMLTHYHGWVAQEAMDEQFALHLLEFFGVTGLREQWSPEKDRFRSNR